MASFEALMLRPDMPEIAERLERRVTLHKLWEATDREATLAAIAPNVRAVVSTWVTARVDAELMRRLPKLEIVVGMGVGYDHIDAAWAGRGRHRRHQHARRARRRRRRPRHRPTRSARDAAPAAGRALSARWPLAGAERFRSPPRSTGAS